MATFFFFKSVDTDPVVAGIICVALPETPVCLQLTKSKYRFYVPFDSQGHIWTGPQHYHL